MQALPVRSRLQALSRSARCYLLLAWQLRRRAALALLVEAFLALGVAFATLAIPFALEGRWTAASWALEGAAALWVGLRQRRRLAVGAGLALQLLALRRLRRRRAGPRARTGGHGGAQQPLPVGGARQRRGLHLRAASLRRPGPEWLEPWRRGLGDGLVAWALLWWLGAGLIEIDRYVAPDLARAVAMAFVAATALAASLAGTRLDWRAARAAPLLLLLPALAAIAAALSPLGGHAGAHPGELGGWWAWPVALAAAYYTPPRGEALAAAEVQTALHTLGLWLIAWLATAELAWRVGAWVRESATWAAAIWGLVPGMLLLLVARRGGGARWPLGTQRVAYAIVGAGGLGAYLLGWVVYSAIASDGTASPLPYVPVVNPMDAAEALALLAIGAALVAVREAPRAAGVRLAAAAGAFVWPNAVLLRTCTTTRRCPTTPPRSRPRRSRRPPSPSSGRCWRSPAWSGRAARRGASRGSRGPRC